MKAYILYIDRENSIKYMKECMETCEKYGIESIQVKNYCDLSSEELTRRTGLRMGSYNPDWSNEYACSVGHVAMWGLISQHEGNEPALVLEHDGLIVSEKIHDVKPVDGQILFLGPKVFSRDDYVFPKGEEIQAVDVSRFHGTHGYAITPNTARFLLSRIHAEGNLLPTPIDGMLGVNNHYRLRLSVVDPPVGLVEIGHRQTFTGDSGLKVAATPTEFFDAVFYNAQHLDGFKRGLKKIEHAGYKFSKMEIYDPIINSIERTINMNNIKKDGKNNILVVGANEGRLTTWFADNYLLNEESVVWGIDSFKGNDYQDNQREKELLRDKYYYNLLMNKNAKRITTFEGSSKQLTDFLKKKQNNFNVLFFDETRDEEAIVDIIVDLYNFIENNGIIMLRDWNNGNQFPVRKAFARIKAALDVDDVSIGCVLSILKR